MVIEDGVLKKVYAQDIVDGKFVVPEGVTEIGEGAFFDCSSLTNVNIPESVTKIGEGAFFDCSSLTDVNIPEGVTEIRQFAFKRM